MIFNLYIYNRKGNCLFYKEWSRPVNTLADDPEEEKKLMFGMLFSLKELTARMSPSVGPEGLHTVKTNSYTLHHFQSLTGLTFVLNTDPEVSDLYQSLQYVYAQIFVECVVKNPLYRYHPDEPVNCPLFEKRLEEYIRSLASFQ
eukprot:gene2262-4399_t